MAQITVKDASGSNVAVELPQPISRAAAANSKPVVLSTEDLAAVNAIAAALAANLNTLNVAGENHIGKFGGESAVPSATLTRQANTTAYAVGQHVSNASPTALALAVARINAGTGVVRRVRLSTSKTGNAGTEVFRVHLFATVPSTIPADAATFSAAVSGVAAGYLGYVDVTLTNLFTDGGKGVAAPTAGAEIMFAAGAGSQNIYALIEARVAYTPASGEVFTVALEVLRD